MKKLTFLLIAASFGLYTNVAQAQAPATNKKAAPKAAAPKAKPDGKAKPKATAVKKHHKRKPTAVTQTEEAIELENGKQKMEIDIRNGGIYINNDLVSTIKDAKKENHKIILNIREEDTVKKTVADDAEVAMHRAMLGVYTETGSNNNGARVMDIKRNSPAAEAGLHIGDLITMLNSKEIKSSDNLTEAINDHNSGESVTITYMRDGQEMKTNAVLEDAVQRPRYQNYEYSVPDLHGSRHMPPAFYNSNHFYSHSGTFEYTPEMGISARTDKHERGVRVLDVKANSPAEDAGLQSGDIIVRLDDTRIANIDDLKDALDDMWMNQKVKVEYRRDGKLKATHLHFSRGHARRDF